MTSIRIRKLQLIGSSSFMITLPREWVLLNKLKQGDEVILQVQNENIVVYPKKKSKKASSAKLKLHKVDRDFVERVFRSLYMLGLDEIIFECENASYQLIDEISDIVHSQTGAEIIDQTDNRIIIHCLTAHDLDIINVLKRMFQVASRAFEEIESLLKYKDEIKDMSKLINDARRLYYLAVRLENRFMQEVHSCDWDALRFILGARMLVKLIREIIELINDLTNILGYGVKIEEVKEDVVDKFSKLYHLFKRSFEAYIYEDFDLDNAEEITRAIDECYQSIKELVNSNSNPNHKLIFQMLLVISREIRDISEIVFARTIREISKSNV